ncbi:hypothetical protein RhiJN_05755 [Ceratobasidium sp. AG-Ba]|nr:hypothetical protein RhiJN_05755 [Ceratobasidium sp. AG-Ba]
MSLRDEESNNAVPRPFEGLWEGDSKIVVGIDIGTTQSGVAFSFLQQGARQTIHRVMQWPGQEASNVFSKIPTLVWYDTEGKAVSFGAEAASPQAEEDAEDNNWRLAKHFKLHLHPSDMRARHDLELDPLPEGVSLRKIYADFLGYLFKHTRSYFELHIVDGALIWENYHTKMEIVIAHPNGWGIREQSFLRAAAVEAGLASQATSRNRIKFVTEAEASVHYCLYHTNLDNRLQTGSKFCVCDAGGSTVDTTVYKVVATRPTLKIEETKASACVQAGAIFVDYAAERYLNAAFGNASLSREEIHDYAVRGMKDFETNAKRNFIDPTKEQKIEEIVDSVGQQIEGIDVSNLLLVGGFGDSPFLRQQLMDQYQPLGCQITLTNESASKAVADGALIWNNISSVTGRAPRFSFGVRTTERYDASSPEHQGRNVWFSAAGHQVVSGHWSQIVEKGVVLDIEAVTRRSFHRDYPSSTPDLEDFETGLYSYSGEGKPRWINDRTGALRSNFQKSCTIRANLSNLVGALERRIGLQGREYWRVNFDVCIRFGGTELEAFLEWEEDGITRTGEVTIIPE